MLWFVLDCASIFGANAALAAFDMVPIGFGLLAPAGVYLSSWGGVI